jgi:hypothetical protein
MRASTMETALAERPGIGGRIIASLAAAGNIVIASRSLGQIAAPHTWREFAAYVGHLSLPYQPREMICTVARFDGRFPKREGLVVTSPQGHLEFCH